MAASLGIKQVVSVDVLHEVEGLCLVMLCSCRVLTRKLAIHLLREVRNIFNLLNTAQVKWKEIIYERRVRIIASIIYCIIY